MIKNRTYKNMVYVVNRITEKGYDRRTANEIALRYFDNLEIYGDSIENQLSHLITKDEFEREYA